MRLFWKNLGNIVISLILAILVWVVAVTEQNPPVEGDFDQAIPIEVIPPKPNLVATNALPEFIRLRLRAPESSWSSLSPAKFKASVDLSALRVGLRDAPVQVEISDPNIEIVSLNPDVISVNLESLQTITIPVEVSLLDTPPLGYFNRPPTVVPAEVTVTGPRSQIDQATKAVAELFVRNVRQTIRRPTEVIIRNAADRALTGLTIKPAQVEVTVPIQQQFGYKDVSPRVRIEGQVAPGYRVSNISVEPQTLTVVGDPDGLRQIAGFVETAPINIDQATSDIVRVVPLGLPDGVTLVLPGQENQGLSGVRVTVQITSIEDSIILQRPVAQQGIDPDYWWHASPEQTDVFLSGPVPLLQSLRAGDVEVIVDLFGLTPGSYQLQPTIFRPDGLQVDAVLPDSIEVTVGYTVQRTITQTGLNPNFAWQAVPGRIDLQLLGEADIIETLLPSEIEVVVDLTDLGPGQHIIEPLVTLPAGVELHSMVPATVEVIIETPTSGSFSTRLPSLATPQAVATPAN